jgi:hypothetical protein
MPMLEFIIALPIGAVVGWIIREIVSDRLARDRAFEVIKINEFNKAASKFRATFIDEIFHIRRGAETLHGRWMERPEDIAIANEKAKIIFETFLSDDMMSGFNSAWEKYEEADTGENSPLTEDGRKKIADIRLSHINNLLEFAKPKI